MSFLGSRLGAVQVVLGCVFEGEGLVVHVPYIVRIQAAVNNFLGLDIYI
jgi:hypothetical protein